MSTGRFLIWTFGNRLNVGYSVILWQTGFVHIAVLRKLKFYNGLYQANKGNNSVVKECFCNIRYDIRFRKLCLDYDMMIDRDCLRYDV